MNYLCLDTTTTHAGVTVIKDRQSYHQSIEPMRASETLVKTIDEYLKKMQSEPSDLKGVLVIKGPGSFTGLRVGIAVANQFAHQLKIPMVGLNTDQWWRHRTDEKGFLFLQSMNRGEIYVKKEDDTFKIEPVDVFKASHQKPIQWLGQLSEDHQKQLSEDYKEITDLNSAEETWKKVIDSIDWKDYEDYELVEPFYGKAPNITPSKKKLGV